VDIVRLVAGHHGQADHGILVHTDEAAGLADAAIFLEVLEHSHGLVMGQFATVEGRTFTFGEALSTGSTDEDAVGFVGAIVEADA
jgi:hypothetical protein